MLCRKSDQLSKQPRGRGDSSWTRGLHDPVSALSEAEPLPLTLEGSAGRARGAATKGQGLVNSSQQGAVRPQVAMAGTGPGQG